jgi:DNA-binding MarR family transcriptional regulator
MAAFPSRLAADFPSGSVWHMTDRTKKAKSQKRLPLSVVEPEHREVAHLLPLYDLGGNSYFGYRMVLAAKLFDRRIVDILEDSGELTLQQWRVVSQLGLLSTGTVRSLANGAAVDRAEVSRAIQELTKLSLVKRQENAADKRSPTFVLTEAGQKVYGSTRKPIIKFIEDLVDDLDPKELEAANRVLWAITKGCLRS